MVLCKEWMVFHSSDEIPEGIRWWIEIIDWRHVFVHLLIDVRE